MVRASTIEQLESIVIGMKCFIILGYNRLLVEALKRNISLTDTRTHFDWHLWFCRTRFWMPMISLRPSNLRQPSYRGSTVACGTTIIALLVDVVDHHLCLIFLISARGIEEENHNLTHFEWCQGMWRLGYLGLEWSSAGYQDAGAHMH